MNGIELSAQTAEEALRAVRALGSHRYVAGRLHLIHVFAIIAADETPGLEEASAWAHTVLADDGIDTSSRDERLYRRATDAELLAVLGAFWRADEEGELAKNRLMELLTAAELPVFPATPFDEDLEEDMHPLLVDAGWELLPLAGLDPEKHKGAIAAYEDDIAFQSAVFNERTSIPETVHLYELPGIGPVELLGAVDEDGDLVVPLVLWTDGDETYHDYVLRGVLRAAKLEPLE